MVRKWRIQILGAIYCVINRGDRREVVSSLSYLHRNK